MKNTVFAGKFFNRVGSPARTLWVALMVVPLLAAPVSAHAEGTALRFQGQVVNAGCSMVQAHGDGDGKPFREITVSPNITLRMETSSAVCSGAVAPFTTRYQPLPVTTLQARDTVPGKLKSEAGVVIVTYQ